MATKEKPATTQAEYEKAWADVKSGKQKAPSFDDMGPLPPAKKEQIKKGVLQGIKGYSPSKEVQKFDENYKKGGKVKCMKKGGSVSSASKRADGCAVKGKTKGRKIGRAHV